MSERSSRAFEFNLRTRGWSLMIDGPNLTLTAVHNKWNQLHFRAFEVLENYESQRPEDISDFLDEFLARNGVKRGDAMLMLPRSQVTLQLAEFPAEAINSLEEVMEYQVGNYFPGNLDQLTFFPQIVSRGETLRVMIAAVPNEVMGKAFALIREYKLKLAGITISTFGLINGLSKSHPNQFNQSQITVFQAFHDGLEVCHVNQGKLTGTHFIPLAPEEDFQRLVPRLEEAFSQSRLDPNDIDTYLWSGSFPPELQTFLKDLGFPEHEWTDATGKTIRNEALAGFGGCVTALHDKLPLGLNLLAENLRKRHKRLPVMLAVVALVALSIFYVYNEVSDYRSLIAERASLKERTGELYDRVVVLTQARNEYEAKVNELELYKRYQANALLVKLIGSLAQELPEDTYLTNLGIKNGDELTLQGESEDPFKTQRILDRLPYLKDFKDGNAITPSRRGNDKKRFTYKATLVLEALR